MSLIQEIDFGTPALEIRDDGDAHHRRQRASPCPRAPRSCARRWKPARRSRNSAPPTWSTPSAPAGSAWSRSRAAPARRPPAPRRSMNGLVVHTQTERLKKLRKGVMELYISDHPLDCLTCAANGDCELQDMAGAVGLRDVRYGYEGENHVFAKADGCSNDNWMPKDESNPYFTYDPSKCIVCSRCVRACEEVQGTFALTIAGRGFDSRVSPGMSESFLDSECVSCGACVQACPTATLTEKSVIEIGQPEHSRRHHLRLLRRRLHLQGRDARRGSRAHGALQGRQGQSRPFLRQGPLRLGLRHPQGAHPQADDPREHRRSLARGVVGRGDQLRRREVQAHPGTSTAATPSAASPRRAAPTKKPIWCRS